MGSEETLLESTHEYAHRYLIGEIGVGLLMIDGPGGRQLDPAAQEIIVEQLNRALAFLTQAEPRAQLRFRQVHRSCHLTSTDLEQHNPSEFDGSPDEKLEDVWLKPATNQLGYNSDMNFLSHVLQETQCRQGFLVLVNKFPLPHFAYSVGAKIVLSYYGGGFGVRNLHALLVHEICHVFGAADEAGGCQCDSRFGYLNISNGNCMQCNPNPQPCIMAGTDLALCAWTRRQIGWDDSLLAPDINARIDAGKPR